MAGRRTAAETPDIIVRYVAMNPGCTATAIGSHLGVGRTHANLYLRQLRDAGRVRAEKIVDNKTTHYLYHPVQADVI